MMIVILILTSYLYHLQKSLEGYDNLSKIDEDFSIEYELINNLKYKIIDDDLEDLDISYISDDRYELTYKDKYFIITIKDKQIYDYEVY